MLAVASVLCQQSPQDWPAVGPLLLVTTSPARAQGTLVPRAGEGRCLQCFGLYFPGGKNLLGCRKSVEVQSYPAAEQLQGHMSSNGQGISWVLALSHIAGLGAGVEDGPVLALLTWPCKSREESKLRREMWMRHCKLQSVPALLPHCLYLGSTSVWRNVWCFCRAESCSHLTHQLRDLHLHANEVV